MEEQDKALRIRNVALRGIVRGERELAAGQTLIVHAAGGRKSSLNDR